MSEDFKIPYQDLTDININNLIVERNALIQENKQLKSILTELEEWLKDENNQQYSKYIWNYSINNWVLDKIQELKEKYK